LPLTGNLVNSHITGRERLKTADELSKVVSGSQLGVHHDGYVVIVVQQDDFRVFSGKGRWLFMSLISWFPKYYSVSQSTRQAPNRKISFRLSDQSADDRHTLAKIEKDRWIFHIPR